MKIGQCCICGHSLLKSATENYYRCEDCGHEVLKDSSVQSFIVNEPMLESTANKVGLLDRFKNRVLLNVLDGKKKSCLLDVGSASGRFLIQNRDLFESVVGLEVTPEAVLFSRNILSLEIHENIDYVKNEVSIATCWHSLEHIPNKSLRHLLAKLSDIMECGGIVIVSVPNSSSLAYKIFRNSYAFYDVPNHLHQFSPTSLKTLFSQYGFLEDSSVFSLPYSVFGYIQSLLNSFFKTHNYMYYRLKRGSIQPSVVLDIINLMLIPFLLPIAFAGVISDFLFTKKQSVLTICFRKETKANMDKIIEIPNEEEGYGADTI